MLRRLFTFLSLVSLALCIATIGLWLRGHFAHDRITFTTSSADLWRLQYDRHSLTVTVVGPWPVAEPLQYASRPTGADWDDPQLTSLPTATNRIIEWRRLGLVGVYGQVHIPMKPNGTPERPSESIGTVRPPVELWSPPMSVNAVHISFALLAAATAVLPIGWFARRAVRRSRERKRVAIGRCRVCGYDLRATPERCPECGAVPVGIPP